MKRFHPRRRDLSLPATILILGLLAAIVLSCGYAVRKYSGAAHDARSLLAKGYFASLASAQRTTPVRPRTPIRTPIGVTPRPLKAATTMASNLVRGYLAVAVGRSAQAERSGIYSRQHDPKEIYLPAVTVFLMDMVNGARTEEVITDLSGRFTIRAEKPSRYQLCWQSKVYGDGCLGQQIFNAGYEPLFLGTMLIPIPYREGYVASFGEVRFADNSPTRAFDPLSDIHSFAVVTLRDAGGNAVAEVPVNNLGDYLLPYLPEKEPVDLVATVEKAQTAHRINTETYKKKPRLIRYHLTIDNRRPRLDAIVPVSTSTGKRVQVAAPGETVLLDAKPNDRDGDPLEIRWIASPNGGTVSSRTGPSVTWTLPADRGRYYVDTFASDGKGGYSRYRVHLAVGLPGVAFGGVVLGSDGTLLDKAQVEINGKTGLTTAQGRFLMYVPSAERYVFNIRKDSYGFYSKIYDRSVAGGRWTLTKATVASFNPNNEIRVQDRRDKRNCPGPDSSQINWQEGPALMQVYYQDGRGNNVPPPYETKIDSPRLTRTASAAAARPRSRRVILPWQQPRPDGCGPGISLVIPPGGLQTSSGGSPVGNASVSLTTVDLATPEQMPGDDSVERTGDPGWMQSYGAGSVDLRDSTGQRLVLKPGVLADITIPVDRMQLVAGAPLPPTAPLLRYDETQGIWREDGVLTLDGAKQNYVAKVNRFSSLNTDVVFTNPSCVGVQVDGTISTPFDLEVTIPLTGGAAPKVKKITITDSPPHVIYNLPNNTDITLVVIAPGPPPKSLGVFVVNTGAAHASGFGTPPPANVCAAQVTLSKQTFPVTPVSGEFLHGLFAFAGTKIIESDIGTTGTVSDDLDKATEDYYENIDLLDERETLTEFQQKNGFTSPPGFHLCSGVPCEDPDTEINVVFANSGDLGFGRDMHCRRTLTGSGYDYACYVTNYGFGGDSVLNTDDEIDAADAVANTAPIATVAMEYSKILAADADSDRHVKFYVYGGNGARVNRADLDGKGLRPIPQLCMVCHGGAYPTGGTANVPTFGSATDVKLGSRFLPFDLRFYTFAASPNKAAQQSAMKKLNVDIVKNAPLLPAPHPIGEVIDEMYAGASATQHEEFVVPGWKQAQLPSTAAQEKFYSRVLGNACRTCHIAQPFQNQSVERFGVDLTFRTAKDFLRPQAGGFTALSAAETRVCVDHVMPHALRTHDIFWGQFWPPYFGTISPTIAAQFQAFGTTMNTLPLPGGWVDAWPPFFNGQLCGVYTGAGTPPPSFYTDFVHPLFSREYAIGGGPSRKCQGCHPALTGTATQSRNTLLVTGLFGTPVAAAGDSNCLLLQRVTGSAGTRMPQGCPSGTVRCLNEQGGIYNPAADLNPANTTTEIDRMKFWIANGVLP